MTAVSLTTDDRLSQASQLQLTWWRFRRHRLAVISLAIVALFYLGAVFAAVIIHGNIRAFLSKADRDRFANPRGRPRHQYIFP